MVLLLPAAFAADLTWECPTVASSADAAAFRDVGALGTEDLYERLLPVALAWVDPACLSDCGAPDADTVCLEGACTDAAGNEVEVHYEGPALEDDFATRRPDDPYTWEVRVRASGVEAPAWTELRVSAQRASGSSWRGDEFWSSVSYEASWTGTLDLELPADGAVEAGFSLAHDEYGETVEERWSDGTCAWAAASEDVTSHLCTDWAITVGAATVEVGSCFAAECEGRLPDGRYWYWNPTWGWTDGAFEGELDATSWAPLTDLDRDGYAVESFDCDDTDPTVHPCNRDDAPHDGIDADCDGAPEDTGGEDTAGEDTAGHDTAADDTAHDDTAGHDTASDDTRDSGDTAAPADTGEPAEDATEAPPRETRGCATTPPGGPPLAALLALVALAMRRR